MPDIFDRAYRGRDAPPERLELLREAYLTASQSLGLAGGATEDRLALLAIIQEVASVEVFRRPADMAQLVVDLYRARRA